MGDFWFNWSVNTVLVAIQAAVKNPEKKAKMRSKMLQLAQAILLAYEGDEEFFK